MTTIISRINLYDKRKHNYSYRKKHPILFWLITIIVLIIVASVVGILLGLLKGSDAPDENQPTNQALNRIQKSVGQPQNQANPTNSTKPRKNSKSNSNTQSTPTNNPKANQLKIEMKNIKLEKDKRNKLLQIYNQLDKSTQNRIYNYAQHYYHIIPSKSLKLKLLAKFLNRYKN